MAYITPEDVKVIRADLKQFKDFKFTVRVRNYSTVVVTIKKAPFKFCDDIKGGRINNYHTCQYDNNEKLDEILAVVNKKNFDNSDIMTDYHHVGFYVDIRQGTYEKEMIVEK